MGMLFPLSFFKQRKSRFFYLSIYLSRGQRKSRAMMSEIGSPMHENQVESSRVDGFDTAVRRRSKRAGRMEIGYKVERELFMSGRNSDESMYERMMWTEKTGYRQDKQSSILAHKQNTKDHTIYCFSLYITFFCASKTFTRLYHIISV